MSDIKLFMAPGTCARVAAICLEEAGQDFDTKVIRFMRGEHRSPEFLLLNPKGKVPTLFIDGNTLTENVAIVTYLNERFPEAHLLPAANDLLDRVRLLEDLSYCASTLHPIVSRIRMSPFFAGQDCALKVWQAGCQAMAENFELIESRLADQQWWYGDTWSALDAYLYWVFWRVSGAEFDVSPYPNYRGHAARMEERPSVRRALAREDMAQKILENEGLVFVPPLPVIPAGQSNQSPKRH